MKQNTLDMIRIKGVEDIKKVIKVIGVGGGGGNAVNHMYNENIHNVSFAVCNADIQDLTKSPIATRIQLGKELTDGLGCGAKPEIGRNAALESTEDIKEMLSDGTKMVFITAGMGGGTGTGAAPVIAQIAKEMDILTIGIVTIPFEFELGSRIKKAIQGVVEMKKYVDALLVINNEKLITLYQDMTLEAAFYKADEVLSESAKGIAEMITLHGEIINVDFADVYTILKDSGVAIMNSGMASGPNRVKDAIEEALQTPLLKSKDIKRATRLLMYVYTSKQNKLTMAEIKEISGFVATINKDQEEVMIWGGTYDDNLEESLKITIIATGFDFTDMDDYDSLYSAYYERNPSEKPQPAIASVPEVEETPEEDPKPEPEEPEKAAEPEAEKAPEMEVVSFLDWSKDISDDSADMDTPPSLRNK